MATGLKTKGKSKPEPIPPLCAGDRLSRDEFERRYHAMPNVNKAELIEGVVYTPSPVSAKGHGTPHFYLTGWLAYFRAHTSGIDGGDNSSLRLDLDNEPQPDVFLRVLPAHGGQSQDTEDGYIAGAPELIAEVSRTTVRYDLHDKLEAYRRNGVREYLVRRVVDQEIDWFALRKRRYVQLPRTAGGLIKSESFPGLWLDTTALLAGDYARVFRVLQQGLASPEHAQFVEKLRKAKK